jgi:calcium binding protein 39
MREDILLPLARNIYKLPFEARKDAQLIFSSALRYRIHQNSEEPVVLPYIISQCPDIVVALCNGYDYRESAMPCGNILREALKHDSIAALIVYDEPQPNGRSRGLQNVNPEVPASGRGVFWKFFEWIDKSAFEVSADAFNTFRVSDIVYQSV